MPDPLPQVRLHNSLTRRTERLEPIEPGKVAIYTCGATVYKYAHIGNLRSYLFGDLLHRTLEYLGYVVRYVKNVTDVGHMRDDDPDSLAASADKMEAAALTEGKSPMEIADFYTAAWLEDEALINILPVDVMPKATEHIGEMISLTERLLEKGLAYEVDGTVYFDVSEFPGYGKLSGQKVEETHAGHRVEVESDKHDPADFALWKHAHEHRSMKWPSPWGEGFPGWHIECSAMSLKHLGERFDIHTGGIDNKFPHHEDEIAQSEGALGHKVVNIWMHGEFLTMADAKMAKSAGNIIRVSDLPDLGHEPITFRYLALTAHYRSKLDFTADAMHAAASGLARLRRAASGPDAAVDLVEEPMARYRALRRCRRRRPCHAEGTGDRPRGRIGRRPDRCAAPCAAARLRSGARAITRYPGRRGGAAAGWCRRATRAPRRRTSGPGLHRLGRTPRRTRRPRRRRARHARGAGDEWAPTLAETIGRCR